jgi:hypothetical protein
MMSPLLFGAVRVVQQEQPTARRRQSEASRPARHWHVTVPSRARAWLTRELTHTAARVEV